MFPTYKVLPSLAIASWCGSCPAEWGQKLLRLGVEDFDPVESRIADVQPAARRVQNQVLKAFIAGGCGQRGVGAAALMLGVVGTGNITPRWSGCR